jgi:hypothetical protein
MFRLLFLKQLFRKALKMLRKLLTSLAALPLFVMGFPLASSAYSPPVCTIYGTVKADRINGTSGADIICAGSGNDVVNGLGGNDIVYGGFGNDVLLGGSGNDELFGEAGSDSIDGGFGNDELSGGAAGDRILGGSGADLILGEAGTDTINGDAGVDLINGGLGKDTIRSGTGADSCSLDSTDLILDACAIDKSAPEIGMQAAVVREFTAGSTIRLNWSVTDSSGVDKAWASIGGQPGWITNWCGFAIEAQLVSGTSKEGVYQIECAVPENAVNGGYSLFVSARDQLGNTTVNAPQIAFTISGGSADDRAPEAVELDFDSKAKAGGEVSFSVSIRDESGADGITGWLMKDGGGFASYPDIGIYAEAKGPAELQTGTNKSGTYNQTLKFSDRAPAGSYTLWLSMRDAVGNKVFEATDAKVIVTAGGN